MCRFQPQPCTWPGSRWNSTAAPTYLTRDRRMYFWFVWRQRVSFSKRFAQLEWPKGWIGFANECKKSLFVLKTLKCLSRIVFMTIKKPGNGLQIVVWWSKGGGDAEERGAWSSRKYSLCIDNKIRYVMVNFLFLYIFELGPFGFVFLPRHLLSPLELKVTQFTVFKHWRNKVNTPTNFGEPLPLTRSFVDYKAANDVQVAASNSQTFI